MNYWIFLKERRVLQLCSKTYKSFLQKLITQDIRKLEKNTCIFSALLTPKGTFHSDFFLIPYQKNDGIFIECHVAHLNPLIDFFHYHGAFHDILFKDLSKIYAICVALGPQVHGLLNLSAEKLSHTKEFLWYTDPRGLGIRALVPYEKLHYLPSSNLFPQQENFYHHLRMQKGIPEGSHDLIPHSSLVLDYNYDLHQAISFEKGSYLGHEMLSKIYYQNSYKRLHSVELTEGVFPSVGSCIKYKKKAIGIMGGARNELGLISLNTKELPDTNANIIFQDVENKEFSIIFRNSTDEECSASFQNSH